VAVADAPVEGRVLVRLPQHPRVNFADTIVFQCRLESPEPIEGFRYDRLLRSRGILAICSFPKHVDVRYSEVWSVRSILFSVKDAAIGALNSTLPEPHVSFVSGLLFGGSSSLSRDLRDDFSRTGTSHIMAASGYNVAIFSALLFLVLRRSFFGKRRAIILVGVLVVLYVLIAGATPPVIRAGIMALIALLGVWLGREQSMRNVLVVAAALMLLGNPRLLFDDVGFQLSLLATIGLVSLAPKIQPWFEFIPNVMQVRESFVASVAAIIITTPLLLWHFGTISIVAPLVNLLILPFIPYAMFFAALSILFYLISSGASLFLVLPAWGISFLILHLVRWFSAIPAAELSVPNATFLGLLSAIVCYLGILWLHLRDRAAKNRLA